MSKLLKQLIGPKKDFDASFANIVNSSYFGKAAEFE